MQERISAVQLADPRIVCSCNIIIIGPDGKEYRLIGVRHFDGVMHAQLNNLIAMWTEQGYVAEDKKRLWSHNCDSQQGFIDQFGNYHDRKSAWAIAVAANQIYRHIPGTENWLNSENLYWG